MRKQYVFPSRSVHITRQNLGNRVKLRPSKVAMPHGVSFSPTIKHALEGVPFYYNRRGTEKYRRKDWQERKKFVKQGDEWNVYTPVRKRSAVIPKTIDDFKRTRERRVLGKVQARKIGRIRVSIGNNRWKYKWI